MRFTQVKVATDSPDELATFYEQALGCVRRTGVQSLEAAARSGVGTREEVTILVLDLPGRGHEITLELISGTGMAAGGSLLTFYVDDLESAVESVRRAGGSYRGKVTRFAAPSGNEFRFVFMIDPEGNVIDLYTESRVS